MDLENDTHWSDQDEDDLLVTSSRELLQAEEGQSGFLTPPIASKSLHHPVSPQQDDDDMLSPNRSSSHSPFVASLEQLSSLEVNEIPYPDQVAIDWQQEFKADRLSHNYISNLKGWKGKAVMLYDTSHVWLVLVASGLVVGVVAAMMNIVSQWLGDIKFGYCRTGFYLKRDFCCLGLQDGETCSDWVLWPQTIGIPFEHNSAGYAFSYFIYILTTIGFTVGASTMVLSYAPYSRLSGIAEIKTILSGYVMHGLLGFNTLVIKALGLCFIEGAGIWAGQEGPLVHIACCCCNMVLNVLKPFPPNEAKKREMLSAAAAAGISVAFGSPVGGVVFTLEVLSYYATDIIMWHGFVCATVAAVCLQWMDPFRTSQLVLFQVTYDRNFHRFELIPFAFIGVLGGLYGSAMIKLNMIFARWRNSNLVFTMYPRVEVTLVALITAITSFPDVYMRIQPSVLLSYLFQECNASTPASLCNIDAWYWTVFLLLIAACIGLVLTAYTFGINIPSGIILPSMMVGALIGRMVGLIMQTWQEKYRHFILFSSCPPDGICITPGVYALVGAASALTGATRLTVSSVVIMFELTGALNYVLPIMAGVMVSKWVSDSFGKDGIYQSWIHHLQYPMIDKSSDVVIPDIPVIDVMTTTDNLILITATGYSVAALQGLLRSSGHQGFPIVRSDNDNTLIGFLSRRELEFSLTSRLNGGIVTPHTLCYFEQTSQDQAGFDLRPWTNMSPITLSVHASFELALNTIESLGLRNVLFTNEGRLEGLMTKDDIWKVMNRMSKPQSSNFDFGAANDLNLENSNLSQALLNDNQNDEM